MKRFKFRLQRVLEHRVSIKKEKERELAIKNGELHEAEVRKGEILDMQNRSHLPADESFTMAELMLHGEYRKRLNTLLEEQREKVLEAKEAVEEARQV